MRVVIWTDRNGWKRASLVRDSDPDDFAPRGVPCGPPDLNLLNLEEVKRELNNILVDKCLFTWRDVQKGQNHITNAVRAAMVRRIILLYKEVANE